ncbi:VOC family protein [Mycolicibacter icosiumassiliensis]|uniref:VOC family protein n=1 Tax=Mycolicibacter icosiumassiliensis TaxID=1792835 RepID=UPI00082F1C1E|nr:VOC family protein [Mycolicibacter icosiumassiliensis]
MSIARLGAVAVNVADINSWQHLLVDLLELDVRPRSSAEDPLFVRLDDRHHRIALYPAASDQIRRVTWEVNTPDELRQLAERVRDAELEINRVSADDPEPPQALSAIRFADPDGFPTEVVVGPLSEHSPVAHGGVISGFITGELGLGHVVYMCKDYQASVDFYTRVLGFELTDYIVWDGADATFLHCNQRHHSLALMNECFGFRGGDFNHFMIEAATLDDVGRAYDRICSAGIDLKLTLGRHTNDGVTSFYLSTPSGFGIEIGWGSQLIGSDWEVKVYDSPARWGHEVKKVR